MIVGIDPGAHSTKAVALRRSGDRMIAVGAARRATFAARKPADFSGIFPAAGPRPGGAVIGLSGRELNLRYIELPPIDDAVKTRQVIRFEVMQILGKNAPDTVDGYRILSIPGKAGEFQVPVLIGLAKRSWIGDLLERARRASIPVLDLTPDTLALYAAARGAGVLPPGETVLLLDLGADHLELAFVKDGELLFARNVSTGSRVLTEGIEAALSCTASRAEELKISEGSLLRQEPLSGVAAEVRAALFNAIGPIQTTIQSSVQFVRGQLKMDLKLDRVFISGGGGRLKGFAEHLASVLNAPLERWDPFAGIDLSGLSADTRAELSADPGAFAVAVGLARLGLEPESGRLSLLPAEKREARSLRRRAAWWAATAATAVIGAEAMFAQAWQARSVEASYYASAREFADQWRGGKEETDRLRAEHDAAERRAKELGVSYAAGDLVVRAYAAVCAASRPGMWISTLALVDPAAGASSGVRVHGVMEEGAPRSAAVMEAFQAKLRETAPDLDVKVTEFDPGGAAGAGLAQFEIVLLPGVPR